jgi:spore germination protein YaaH
MASTYRASASASTNGAGSTFTINKPTGTVQGDILVALMTHDVGTSTTVTPPAGWTSIATINNGATIGQDAYYLFAGASEPASYTWTMNAANAMDGGILCFTSGINTSVPVDVKSTNTGASTAIVATGVTTTAYGDILIAGWSTNNNVSPSAGDAGMTNAVDQHSATSNAIYIDYLVLTAPGATGNQTVTMAISESFATQLIALRQQVFAVSDAATGSETVAAGSGTVAVPDSGTGTESLTIGKLLTDSAKATEAITTAAWIYPGAPACNANIEYADGRHIDSLLPEYYTVQTNGTLRQVTVAIDGCNGYTAANARDIKRFSASPRFTVSTAGAYTGLVNLWSNSTNVTNFVNTVVAFCGTTGFTGVDCDFENWDQYTTTDWTNYKALMTTLGNALHASGYTLQIDGPAITNSTDQAFYPNFKYEDLDTLPIDFIVVEAYDYMYGNGAGTANAPLTWISAICAWMQAKIVTNPQKIVVGLPSFGYHGTTGGFTITIDTYNQSAGLTGFGTATRDLGSGEMHWATGGSSYFYCDAIAMDLKKQTVLATGITSIAVWHLGGNLWFSSSGSSPVTYATITEAITDTATGGETVVTPVTPKAVSDTATAGETAALGTIAPALTDASTGVDVFSGVTLPLTDAGTGAETPAIAIAVAPTDAGTGAETPVIGVTIPADPATGTDAVSVATISTYDPATGTDTISVAASAPQTDAGTGVQTVLFAPVTIGITDAPTGADAQSFATYTSKMLTDTPYALYLLGDNTGATVAIDSSGNARNGTYAGGVTFGVAGPTTQNTPGVLLNGSTGRAAMLSTIDPATFTNGFSVACWVKFAVVSGNPRMLANGHPDIDNKGFQLFYNTGSGFVEFRVGLGAFTNGIQYTTTLVPGVWYHFGATFNKVNTRLYFNGVAVGTPGSGSGSMVSEGAVAVGIGYNPVYNGDYVNGAMWSVVLSDQVWSATQFARQYLWGSDASSLNAQIGFVADSALSGEALSFGTVTTGIIDATTSTDNVSPLVVLPGITDPATGTDTPTLPGTVTPGIGDAGLASESLSFGTVAPALTDATTATDNVAAVMVPQVPASPATGSETVTFGTIAPAVAEVGVGLEAPTLGTITPGVADAGVGADAVTLPSTQPIPVSDTATGTDALALPTITPSIPTSGAGQDTVTLPTLTQAITDAATGVDSPTVTPFVVLPAIPDTGAGGETVSLGTISPGVLDTGLTTESPAIGVTLPTIPDTGATNTGIGFAPPLIPVADVGAGVETIAVPSVLVPLQDVAGTGESIGTGVTLAPADGATTSETITGSTTLGVPDTGTGTDVPTLFVPLTIPTTGVGTDVPTLGTVTPAITDLETGVDTPTIGIVLPTDTGTGVDTVGIAIPTTDAGTTTETISIGHPAYSRMRILYVPGAAALVQGD